VEYVKFSLYLEIILLFSTLVNNCFPSDKVGQFDSLG